MKGSVKMKNYNSEINKLRKTKLAVPGSLKKDIFNTIEYKQLSIFEKYKFNINFKPLIAGGVVAIILFLGATQYYSNKND